MWETYGDHPGVETPDQPDEVDVDDDVVVGRGLRRVRRVGQLRKLWLTGPRIPLLIVVTRPVYFATVAVWCRTNA